MKSLYIACCIILGISLLPLPGGFYFLTRILVTIVAIVAMCQNFDNGINGRTIGFGIIALIFNPIIPVFLHDKGLWVIIDIVALVVFIIQILRTKA